MKFSAKEAGNVTDYIKSYTKFKDLQTSVDPIETASSLIGSESQCGRTVSTNSSRNHYVATEQTVCHNDHEKSYRAEIPPVTSFADRRTKVTTLRAKEVPANAIRSTAVAATAPAAPRGRKK